VTGSPLLPSRRYFPDHPPVLRHPAEMPSLGWRHCLARRFLAASSTVVRTRVGLVSGRLAAEIHSKDCSFGRPRKRVPVAAGFREAIEASCQITRLAEALDLVDRRPGAVLPLRPRRLSAPTPASGRPPPGGSTRSLLRFDQELLDFLAQRRSSPARRCAAAAGCRSSRTQCLLDDVIVAEPPVGALVVDQPDTTRAAGVSLQPAMPGLSIRDVDLVIGHVTPLSSDV